jgi:hypothetical protein
LCNPIFEGFSPQLMTSNGQPLLFEFLPRIAILAEIGASHPHIYDAETHDYLQLKDEMVRKMELIMVTLKPIGFSIDSKASFDLLGSVIATAGIVHKGNKTVQVRVLTDKSKSDLTIEHDNVLSYNEKAPDSLRPLVVARNQIFECTQSIETNDSTIPGYLIASNTREYIRSGWIVYDRVAQHVVTELTGDETVYYEHHRGTTTIKTNHMCIKPHDRPPLINRDAVGVVAGSLSHFMLGTHTSVCLYAITEKAIITRVEMFYGVSDKICAICALPPSSEQIREKIEFLARFIRHSALFGIAPLLGLVLEYVADV